MAMRKGIQHKLSTGGMETVMRTAKRPGIPVSEPATNKTSGEGGIPQYNLYIFT